MKNLLIIHTTQYGYHTNAIKHANGLRDEYAIKFLCCKEKGRRIIRAEGLKVQYIPFFNIKIIHKAIFAVYVLLNVAFFRGLFFVYYFRGCGILKAIFPNKMMILDVRTLGVSPIDSDNEIFNTRLYNAAIRFDFVAFLSESIRDKISFPIEKSAIVPLGSDVISYSRKKYYPIKLLYVGTLNNRDIDKTIDGVIQFKKLHPEADIEYHVVGYGAPSLEAELRKNVISNSMSGVIFFHGLTPHSELKPFFDNCNVGVSFVPITPYYNLQPVTKSFEYAMSGLYVIATATNENKRIITNNNGVLIEDTTEAVSEALEYIYRNHQNINEDTIRDSLLEYRWESIIDNKLKPIFKRFYHKI